jgi:hypothetical protein
MANSLNLSLIAELRTFIKKRLWQHQFRIDPPQPFLSQISDRLRRVESLRE